MSIPETSLVVRARRSYEMGRLARASGRACLLVPLLGLSLAGCSPTHQVFAGAAVLLVAVTLLLWRGQEWGQGVGPGITAGLVPMLLPIVAEAAGHLCGTGGCLLLPTLCAAGGLVGGILLGAMAPRPRTGRMIPFLVACSVAALTGAVGCLLYGLIGLAIMGAGLLVGAAPLVAVRRS